MTIGVGLSCIDDAIVCRRATKWHMDTTSRTTYSAMADCGRQIYGRFLADSDGIAALSGALFLGVLHGRATGQY